MVAGLFSSSALQPGGWYMFSIGFDHLKQLMVDSLPDCGLVLLDTEGKVLSWNEGAKGLLGYEEADAVGQPFARIVPSETLDPAGAPPALAKARRHGRHEEICQRTRSDGTGLELREVVIPLRDPQHNLVAFGLMMQSLAAHGTSNSTRAAHATPNPSRRKARVLVVDDEDIVRAVTSNMLDDIGYEVFEAASGAEALDILTRDESIDLLFADVIMPGMGGRELAERAQAIRPDLKLVFASGYFPHALREKGNLAPGTDVLVKPYRRRDLARVMSRVLAEDVPDVEQSSWSRAPVPPSRDYAGAGHAWL